MRKDTAPNAIDNRSVIPTLLITSKVPLIGNKLEMALPRELIRAMSVKNTIEKTAIVIKFFI